MPKHTHYSQSIFFDVSYIWQCGSVLAAACPSIFLHGKAKAGGAAVKTLIRYRTEEISLITEMALIGADAE